MNLLTVCTGNIARSPIAEAFLTSKLNALGLNWSVSSAGLLYSGKKAAPETLSVMRERGYDLSHHFSNSIEEVDLRSMDLILGMAREHVREVVVTDPSLWPRTFTIKGLVKCGEKVGPRRSHEAMATWLDIIGSSREKSDLLGADLKEDIVDPFDRGEDAFNSVADELDLITDRVVALISGEG